MPPVGVIGAGAWGTALAVAAARAGQRVVLWGRDPVAMRALTASRRNDAHLPGIDLLGPMPAEVQIHTTFSAALCSRAVQPQAVRALLDWLRSPATATLKRRHGFEPA